ncbi:uncharacterized protein [Leptinotarsa decemlineata]|uniref:uncharacterized protein n=1 Tax=Leptinotarsa decemlineata TaxID=7539 RepID=UPI003D30517C
MAGRRSTKRRRRSSSSESSSSSSSEESSSSSEPKRRAHREKSGKRKGRRSRVRSTYFDFCERGESKNVSTICEFDPKSDSVRDWLSIVDQHATCFKWDDNTTKTIALSKLGNTASQWFQTYIQTEIGWANYSWAKWKKILSTTFQSVRNTHKFFMEVANHKPFEGESLYSFHFDHLAKIEALKANFSEADKVSLIVGAIGDDTVASAVRAANITDLNLLASYLRDRTYAESGPSHKQIYNNTSNIKLKQPKPTGKNDKNLKIQSTQIKCFHCNKRGHKRSECRSYNIRKCNFCHRKGHIEADCYSQKRQTEVKSEKFIEKPQKINVIESSNKDKFYRKIKINDTSLLAFIDFGSDCSILEHELAQELGLKVCKLSVPALLSGFLDNITKVDEIVEASVTIDQITLLCRFYVINSLSVDCQCIVGRNFTENIAINYQRVGNDLTFSYAQEPLEKR